MFLNVCLVLIILLLFQIARTAATITRNQRAMAGNQVGIASILRSKS